MLGSPKSPLQPGGWAVTFVLLVAILVAYYILLGVRRKVSFVESKLATIDQTVQSLERQVDALTSRGTKEVAATVAVTPSVPPAAPPRITELPVEPLPAPAPPAIVSSAAPPTPSPAAPAAPAGVDLVGAWSSLRPVESEPSGAAIPPKGGIDTWETAIGGSWLSRIGIGLLVIGIALALGYSFTVLGPLGKASLATATSLALIGAGVVLERRTEYEFYARGLIGGGWAALYVTVYAMHELEATRIVESVALGFALLLAVGIGMIVHSLRYENQGLTTLAYGLGYAAIAIHSIRDYTIFAATLLGAGTVVHLLRRRWLGLAIGGAIATYGSLLLWYLRQGTLTQSTLRLGLTALAINWVVFLVAEFGPDPSEIEERSLLGLLAVLNAGAAGGLAFLAWHRLDPAMEWVPLAVFGAAYVATSTALRRLGRSTVHPIHSVAAALLLAAAAHSAFSLRGATWAWLFEAQAVVLLGVILRDRFHRVLGCALFLLPTVAILAEQVVPRASNGHGSFDGPDLLLTAAACGCFYLTYARLRGFETDLLFRRIFSYAAFSMILVALFVQLPTVRVAPASALLALVLFEASNARKDKDLRVQTHLALLFSTIFALALLPSALSGSSRVPFRVAAAALSVSAACLVVFLRSRGGARRLLEADPWIRSVLSWAGVAFVCLAIWLEARAPLVGPSWTLVALLVVEAGIALGERDLRRPGYAALAAALVSIVLSNLVPSDRVGAVSTRVATVVPVIAAVYYLWFRLRGLGIDPATRRGDDVDEVAGRALSYAGAALAGLFYRFEFGLDGAAIRWSFTMVGLLVAARLLRDADLRLQAYALSVSVLVRAVGFDFRTMRPVLGMDGPFVVVAVAVLCYAAAGWIASLPPTGEPRRTIPFGERLVPYGRELLWNLAVAVAAIYLYRTFSGFLLVVAWAVEGLLVSAAGFALGVRSLRLAGLLLLAIALVMTFYRAFTTFDTMGRIVSFLVLGVVLLLVSFAYTRYRDVIRKSI